MKIKKNKFSSPSLILALIAFASIALSQPGSSVYQGDWPVYTSNMAGQRYSPLDQINAENVADLEIAWRFSTENLGPSTDFNNPSTPIEVDGVLYANIASTRNVAAIDASTGQVLWLGRYKVVDSFDQVPT